MDLGGTTSTKRSQNGPMEPPDPGGPLPLGPPVPTDINQKVNQLLQESQYSWRLFIALAMKNTHSPILAIAKAIYSIPSLFPMGGICG